MTLYRYDTYGWLAADIDETAQRVGEVLGIELEPRHSLYHGDYYGWRGPGQADLLLQQNFIEDDGLPTDDEHPDHKVLLYASVLPEDWFDALMRLPGVERLSSSVLP